MEEALRATSADTLKRITESLAKEILDKKRHKHDVVDVNDNDEEEEDDDDEVRRRQVRSAERDDRRASTPDEEASLSPTPHMFNAKVKTSNNDVGSERGTSSPRGKKSLKPLSSSVTRCWCKK